MIDDFRRPWREPLSLIICGDNQQHKFLGVHLVENLFWFINTSSMTKKIQQSLLLVKAEETQLSPLIMFYRETIESILSSCINIWYKCHKTLQPVVRTAEKINRVSLSSIIDIYHTCCVPKAAGIEDPTHPLQTL